MASTRRKFSNIDVELFWKYRVFTSVFAQNLWDNKMRLLHLFRYWDGQSFWYPMLFVTRFWVFISHIVGDVHHFLNSYYAINHRLYTSFKCRTNGPSNSFIGLLTSIKIFKWKHQQKTYFTLSMIKLIKDLFIPSSLH